MPKILFTPGPLTTSATVKEAMLRDLGSRDEEFIELVRNVRRDLLELGHVSQAAGYEAVIVQGSGTFGVESVIGTALGPFDQLLVLINGQYGERILHIAQTLGIPVVPLRFREDQTVEAGAVERAMAEHPSITHVAIVHCETTTGILNPVDAIGTLVRAAGKHYIVDSMSAFGSVPLDIAAAEIDYLVSSANKCIEGVPGFSFAVCRRAALVETDGNARSVSLDLFAQWKALEGSGQFRFTPPTHALLAFAQALAELREEGGVAARANRYAENQRLLVAGMRRLGFREYLPAAVQGNAITTFHDLDHANFSFEELYQRLSDRGFVIYPGKLSRDPAFRIGSCGRIDSSHIRGLLDAVRAVLAEMQIDAAPID